LLQVGDLFELDVKLRCQKVKMSSHSIMSGKNANNNPGLCPVKGQKSGLCSWARTRNQFSSLKVVHTYIAIIVAITVTTADVSDRLCSKLHYRTYFIHHQCHHYDLYI